MVQRWKDVERLTLHGVDGEIGVLDDALIDDGWVVRYLVVAPTSLLGQRVVVSPIAVTVIDWTRGRAELRLSRQQVRESPDLLSLAPLTRQTEASYAAYYGYAAYWGGPDLWAWAGRPGALASAPPDAYRASTADDGAVRLNSVKRLRGRHLVADDGPIGHVDDGFVDDDSWVLAYLLVDTSNRIGGRHVLLPTGTIRNLADQEGPLAVEARADRIRDAPEYDSDRPVDSAIERNVTRHYGTQPPPAERRSVVSGAES